MKATFDELRAAFHEAAQLRELALVRAEQAQKMADEVRRGYVLADNRFIDAWLAYCNAMEGAK